MMNVLKLNCRKNVDQESRPRLKEIAHSLLYPKKELRKTTLYWKKSEMKCIIVILHNQQLLYRTFLNLQRKILISNNNKLQYFNHLEVLML